MILAEIENLDSFKAAMRAGEKVAARGLWHGTSQSLARFRRDQFLKKTPAHIRGRKSANPRTRNTGKKPPIGRTFLWSVSPKTPPKATKFSSDHVKSVKEVSGQIGSDSEAAYAMEKELTIRPKKGAWLGLPVVSHPSADNAAKKKSGQRYQRVKPSWRVLRQILKKRNYNFQFQDRNQQLVVFARHKRSTAKPFVVMVLVPKVQMTNVLKFEELFFGFRTRIKETYESNLQKQLQKLANQANRGR